MSILRKNKRLFAEVLSDLKNHVDLSLLAIEPVLLKHVENRAKHIAAKTFSYIAEYSMYLMGLGCLSMIFLLKSIAPFYVLDEMANKRIVLDAIGHSDIETFTLAVRFIFFVLTILFIVIGALIRGNRHQRISIYNSAQELLQIKDHLKSGSQDLNLLDENYLELKALKEAAEV